MRQSQEQSLVLACACLFSVILGANCPQTAPVLCLGKSCWKQAGNQLTLKQFGYSGVQCMRKIPHPLPLAIHVPVYLQSEAYLQVLQGGETARLLQFKKLHLQMKGYQTSFQVIICSCSAVTIGFKWSFLSCLNSLELLELTVNILLFYLFPTRAFNSVLVMFFLVSFLVFFQKRLFINLLGS